MSQYGILLDGFWDGNTGRDIARVGGAAAQLVAVYLLQNPDANMIGLYFMRLPVMRERIHTLTQRSIDRAFGVLAQVEFAEYDLATEHVWVHEMAKYRLTLHKTALKPTDNRAVHARSLYGRLKPNPFLVPFFKRYRADLHLDKPRRFEGAPNILRRGLQGASKPLTESETEITKQITETDQDQKQQGRSLARTERAPTTALLIEFDRLHQDRLRAPAVIQAGKDAKLLAGLCRSHGPDVVTALIADFFASRDPFIEQAGFTVGVFVSQAGKLIARRQRQAPRVDDAWFEDCQRLHDGTCGGRMRHANQLAIDAEKARKESA